MKNTLHKIALFALLLFITISLSNCRKNKHEDKPTENLGLFSLGEAKDYMLFKQGSWWVYKNSYTNELDTMTLTNIDLATIHRVDSFKEESKTLVYDFEYITYNIYSKRDHASYHTYCSNMGGGDEHFFEIWVFQCERKGGVYNKNGDGISTDFYYPFYTNNEHKGYEAAKKDTMTVNGKVYSGIVSFSIIYDEICPYPNVYIFPHGNSIYHWARHIGIVKIEHQSYDKNMQEVKMNWDLIESHIIQ